jgi:hypothetical protein
MTITYTFKIRQTTTTTVYGIQDVISHIHYDYVGVNEFDQKTFCQGVLPFELKPITTINPSNGETITIPAVFDENNYIPYDQITDEILVSWLNDSVPLEVIQIFKQIISQKLDPQE